MFSQLGPLFKTEFRKTEKNDTRQDIPHKEKDLTDGNNGDEAAKEKAPKWEDEASVSTTALRSFLIDFLKNLPDANIQEIEAQFDNTPNEQANEARAHEPERPTNTKNAKAVRAYQTMAKYASKDKDEAQEGIEANKPKKNKIPDTIHSKEYRDIYILIQDLENLSQQGINNLSIYKADTFVESLKTAVALEKKRI